MWGIPIAFIAGYVVARWFGDNLKSVAAHAWDEMGKVLKEWA